MKSTISVLSYSGHAVLYDPAAFDTGDREPSIEDLEAAMAGGRLLLFPALDDETIVTLLVDEPPPDELASLGSVEVSATIRVPGGRLLLGDPGMLPGPPGPAIAVEPGRYSAEALLIQWPAQKVEGDLRRAAGRLSVAIRDVLGLATFGLGALTVIGLPVFLIGRALDDGLGGVAGTLVLAGMVLVPLWLLVIVAFRLPVVRRVDRIDAAVARSHPDAAVVLHRLD